MGARAGPAHGANLSAPEEMSEPTADVPADVTLFLAARGEVITVRSRVSTKDLFAAASSGRRRAAPFDSFTRVKGLNMNPTDNQRPESRFVHTPTGVHAFGVGQSVRLRGGFPQRSHKVDVYQIIALLPPLGESPQYRIRSAAEPHDRIATEETLDAVAAGAAEPRATLASKVFAEE